MSDISLADSVAISEDVVSREIAGETVLLDLGSGTYFGLNETGTRIWNLLQDDGLLRQAFDTARTEYDVAPQDFERDFLALVRQLCARGLVRVSTHER
jgi:Coenzyme PQQ synthesis protein D (PqqD)